MTWGTTLLVADSLFLGGLARLAARRSGGWLRPLPAFALFLLAYLPGRGLLIRWVPQSIATPPRVSGLLKDPDLVNRADINCSLIVLIFGIAIWLAVRGSTPDRGTDDAASRLPLSALHSLWLVSLPGVAVVAMRYAAFAYGTPPPPSPVNQIGLSLTAVHLIVASILVIRRVRNGASIFRRLVPTYAVILAGFATGSKDLLLEVGLALLIAHCFVPVTQRTASAAIGSFLLVVTAIFVVFPIVQATRGSGDSPVVAGTTLLTGSRPSVLATFGALSDRLHGYDSMVIATADAGSDPTLLPTRSLTFLPLFVVYSYSNVSTEANVGRDFAIRHWSLASNYASNTRASIAPSAPGQLLIASGTLAMATICALYAVGIYYVDRICRSRFQVLGFGVCFVLARMTFGLERDVVSSVITAMRAILVWSLVAAWLSSRASLSAAVPSPARVVPQRAGAPRRGVWVG